jgi:hypothetical protein
VCSFSNGKYVKTGLAELEHWISEATVKYAGNSWEELRDIRQTVGFLVIYQKPKKTLEEITCDLCSVLSIQQANTRRMLQQKKHQHVKQATVCKLEQGVWQPGDFKKRRSKRRQQQSCRYAAWHALIGQLSYALMLIDLLNQSHRIQNLSLPESDGIQKSRVG